MDLAIYEQAIELRGKIREHESSDAVSQLISQIQTGSAVFTRTDALEIRIPDIHIPKVLNFLKVLKAEGDVVLAALVAEFEAL